VKIAFHAPRAPYLDPHAGAGDSVMTRNLIETLTARGHLTEVVSYVDARDFYQGRLPVRRLFAEAFSIRRRMREFAPDAWIVYGPSATYPDLFGWWLRPRKYVLYAASRGREERLPIRWRWLYVFAHRRSLARADGITVQRPTGERRLNEVGVASDKVHILPPAPRRWPKIPSREEARLRLELPPQAPIVLCLARFSKPSSRLGKTNMAITLLQVLAELPQDVILLLVGDDGHGRRRVEDEIARLELERKVRLVGPKERERLMGSISNDNVPWFYAAADVYAYPHPENQPWLSVVEAQACGRPVVTMRTESSELIIRHDETGLLATDVDEFRSYLGALLSDPERRESMGRAAYENFTAHHSIERRIVQIEALLRGPGHRD
jgi:glycosyltransferase involved in cell wall biosynthesis